VKIRTSYIIGIGIFVIGISLALRFGIKNPPEKLAAIELPTIEKIRVNKGPIHILTENEIELWKDLDFVISTENYPGETPDFIIDLIGNESNFTAMYNESSRIVFFSFVSEIQYGFLNSPPPGGWTKPLYETQADEKLLELLKVL
jgi:hypothetical protein